VEEVAGYRFDRRIGEGGMSEVWAATDMGRQRIVAIKMLLPKARANAEIVARFRREAELLRRIDSDHVPRLYEFLDGPNGPVLVEEYITGELLAHALEKKRFSLEDAIALGTGVARALVELHRAGIVHRDLKPGNIILHPQGRAVLIDLGVSRLSLYASQEDTDALTEITKVARAVGTIAYMAPEQFVPSSRVSEAVDLYALGAILFRTVTGHHVFGDLPSMEVARAKMVHEAPPLDTHREGEVARAFERLVMRCLRRDPEDRYRTADELLGDLLMLGQGVVPRIDAATLPSIAIDLSAWRARRRWPGATPTLALVAGLLVGALLQRQWMAPVAHAEVPACVVSACVVPPPPAEPEMCMPPEEPTAAPLKHLAGRRKPHATVQVVDEEEPRPLSPP